MLFWGGGGFFDRGIDCKALVPSRRTTKTYDSAAVDS